MATYNQGINNLHEFDSSIQSAKNISKNRAKHMQNDDTDMVFKESATDHIKQKLRELTVNVQKEKTTKDHFCDLIAAKLKSMRNSSTKEYLMLEIHRFVLSSDMGQTATRQNQLNNTLLNVPNYSFNNSQKDQRVSNTNQLQGIWTQMKIPQIPLQSNFRANRELQSITESE